MDMVNISKKQQPTSVFLNVFLEENISFIKTDSSHFFIFFAVYRLTVLGVSRQVSDFVLKNAKE